MEMGLVVYGGGCSNTSMYMEKRQLFLRSYQFRRKKSLTERMKASVRRVVFLRIKSARKIRRLVWSRLRWALNCRRRRFVRLIHPHHHNNSSSSCFW